LLTKLELRKLRKLVFKQFRRAKKNRFETYTLEWQRIRKQKDRRRRKCIAKLYRITRERELRGGALELAA
jgi:hypothetical protein